MNDEEELVFDRLNVIYSAQGFSARRIPRDNLTKRPDVVIEGHGERLLLEIKTKGDDVEETRRKDAILDAGQV